MKKILIAIPTAKNIESDTFRSIFNCVKYLPEGYEADFQYFYGYRVDQVRNLIADWVIRGYDYLFAVDYDMIFPADTLKKLIEADKDIVSAIYRQRLEPQAIEIYNKQNVRMEYKDLFKKYEEIGACGLGCALIKKEVFIQIGYPQFEYFPALDHNHTFSEDLDFCGKARNKGFTIWCIPTITCGHIGTKIFEVEIPPQNKIYERFDNLRAQRLLPQSHKDALVQLKEDGFIPQTIYDLGACVLHWYDEAKEVWPDSLIIPIEAMAEVDMLYEKEGINIYSTGLALWNTDGEQIEFYQNLEHPGGNSHYKENNLLSPGARFIFSEDTKISKETIRLDTLAGMCNWPRPDLIKMDIQGAEMNALSGADNLLKTAKYLILELQHLDYNIGAPKHKEVIEYLKGKGFNLVKDFGGSPLGVDKDYLFVNSNLT